MEPIFNYKISNFFNKASYAASTANIDYLLQLLFKREVTLGK